MTYPYIGEGKKSGSIALIYDKAKCITLKSKTWASDDLELCEGINEHFFKNITTEYLANTYGEVKSKEHAEFIVSLNSGKESSISELWSDKIKYFIIDGAGKLCFSNNVYTIDKAGKREITIPLPPECDESPEQVIAIGKVFDRTSDGLYRWVSDCGIMEIVRDLDSLKEADDFAIVSYESGSDEWPKVNDNVVIDDENGIVKLPADAQDYYIVEVNGLYKQCKFGELSKPKTPEQELRDLLLLLWEENNHDFDMLLDVVTEHVIKKPQ